MDEKKSDDDHHDAANGATTALPLLSPSKVEPNFEAPYGPTVHISKHPVLKHKLSILRSSSTKPAAFRTVLREITFHLAYEATATLTTRDIPITVPSAKVQLNGSGGGDHHLDAIGQKIKEKVALIPILRSGLGMVDPMLELIDNATVHHIGMYRNSKSLMPVQYYNRLPKICDVDVAYILDPLIATSATVISVVGMMKKWGVSTIHVLSVIASRKGLSELLKYHPDVHVTIGHVDEALNEEGDLVPGLGDAGDRLFGTTHPSILEGGGEDGSEELEDQELVHFSKRKRTMSVDAGN